MAGSLGSAAVRGLFSAATSAARQAKPLLQKAGSQVGGAAQDKLLSSLSSGFRAQMQNPSQVRHLFSAQLKDASHKFSSGSLSDMMLTPMKSSARQLQSFVKSNLPEVYDKSSTFRAIFNHAYRDDVRHHGNPPQWHANPNSKLTHGAEAAISKKELGLQVLNDILEGAKPTYTTDQGERPLSPLRAFVSSAVEGLTSLRPQDEPEHPRGASTELSNMVMSEVAPHEEPCIRSSSPDDMEIHAPVPQRPPASNSAATFRQNMQTLERQGSFDAPTARSHTTGDMQATYQPGHDDGHLDLLAQGAQAKQAQRDMQRQAIEQQLKAPPAVPPKIPLDAPDVPPKVALTPPPPKGPPVPPKVALDPQQQTGAPPVPPKVGNNATLQRRPALRRAQSDTLMARRQAAAQQNQPALRRTQSEPARVQSDSFNAEYTNWQNANEALNRKPVSQNAAPPVPPRPTVQRSQSEAPPVPPRPAPLRRTQSEPARVQSDSFNAEYTNWQNANDALNRKS